MIKCFYPVSSLLTRFTIKSRFCENKSRSLLQELQIFRRHSRCLSSYRISHSQESRSNSFTSHIFSSGDVCVFSTTSLSYHNTLLRDYDFLPFKPFEPPKRIGISNKNTVEYLKGFPKFFFARHKNDEKRPKRRIPRLILLQNPFTWLMVKIDFCVLRNIWDSSFAEKDFKFGTKQAISRVTNVISEGQFAELNGLLTRAARLSLQRELDRNWSEKQRALLALQRDDIQISSPRKVYFIRLADKKYCDVDMAFLALKWAPINNIDALIFTEIFARFHREYTPHCIPEWTIAYFKVTRFEVLKRKPRIQ